ncbi:MAG TPA: hypothetical protein VFB25_11630 [Gaiellaceae bacterium]|nr:hypothetical protein [Gaiellaceae bacterium]
MRGSKAGLSFFAGVVGVFAVMAAGCGGSSPKSVAGAAKTTLSRTDTTPPGTTTSSAATTRPATGPAKFLDEWAVCERAHGDAHQPVPTIDVHGVINIVAPFASPGGVHIRGGPEPATGTCSAYLNKARRALRSAHPVRDPNGPDHATQIKYARCMRANGVPNFPYPEANDPSRTDFNGTGVDPNSPAVVRVNNLCGKELGLPTWWIKGWGMPGDISVRSPGVPDNQ